MALIDVVSEMTGTIWKIQKSVGDAVEQDEILIIIEAMKMEIPVMAPEAGTVAEILVEEGAMIADGDVVMRLNAV
ncbi:MAG: acetyl-CoA carboxylase biotin carboxyl carrier protein subunit [Pseudomonadota bacterium]